jgi:hypothetical protein
MGEQRDSSAARDRIRIDRGVAGAPDQAIAPDQRNQSQV